jgi:hypothetical protein
MIDTRESINKCKKTCKICNYSTEAEFGSAELVEHTNSHVGPNSTNIERAIWIIET